MFVYKKSIDYSTHLINSLPAPMSNVMILGDSNFPQLDWANFNSNDTYINMLQSFANNLFVEQ